MSRITNDMETISRPSASPGHVTGSALLIVWIAYNVLAQRPLCPAEHGGHPGDGGHALAFRPARKAFRITRVEIGRVNADLQETISGVREVQAFGREEVTWSSSARPTRLTGTPTSGRCRTLRPCPSLDALGYVAVAIVAVGRARPPAGQPLFGTAVFWA